MIAGGIALVNYGEPGPIWHTRALLAHSGGSDWAILTPDHDIYIENMSIANSDFTDFHYCGVNGAIPARIDPATVYAFAPLTPAELGAFRLQGEALVGAGPAGLPAHVAAPVAPVVAAHAAPAQAGMEDTWVAIEDGGDFKRGDIVCSDPSPSCSPRSACCDSCRWRKHCVEEGQEGRGSIYEVRRSADFARALWQPRCAPARIPCSSGFDGWHRAPGRRPAAHWSSFCLKSPERDARPSLFTGHLPWTLDSNQWDCEGGPFCIWTWNLVKDPGKYGCGGSVEHSIFAVCGADMPQTASHPGSTSCEPRPTWLQCSRSFHGMEVQENGPRNRFFLGPACGQWVESRSRNSEGKSESKRRTSSPPQGSPRKKGDWRRAGAMTAMKSCSSLVQGGQQDSVLGLASGTDFNSHLQEPSPLRPDQERWRELFPLPLCEPVPHQAGLSVSSRRRKAKVRSNVERTNEVIKVLNEMYGSSQDGAFSFSSCPTSAQRQAQHELFSEVSKTKDPQSVLSMREAVEELLQSDLSYSGEVATTVRGYDRGLLSIPSSGNCAVDMMGLLDEQGQEVIADPHRCMMLSEEEYGDILEKSGSLCTYMDPLLRDDLPTYCTFIEDLYRSGMLEFTNSPQELVTPFCVTKKSGKHRLILDCRGVNRRFKAPPPLALGTGSSWARIHIPKNKQLFVAQSDLKDYFYTLQLPESLRQLFSLPPVPSYLLRQWGIGAEHGGQLHYEGGWAHPMLRVVPMGWSWAMWLTQRVHQYQAQLGTGVSTERVLVDGKEAPDLSSGEVLLLPYADNLNIAGTDERRVQQAKEAAVCRLREVGLLVHEELDACSSAQSLGFVIDGQAGRVSPVPARLMRVQLAFKWLSRRPRISGKGVQRLLGHAVHFMMLKRCLLSIPRRLYDFVQYAGHRKCRLWTGAAVEAKWLATLLPLCSADLRKQISSVATASDASLSGIAVCSKQSNIETLLGMSSTRESWRYKGREPSNRPRSQALGHGDPFSDISTVKPIGLETEDPFELNASFKEVSGDFMKSEDWSLRFAQNMQFPEHITALEGRGVVAALRHKLRALDQFGLTHFHLCDNLGMVLALDKGRSSSMPLLRTCRRVACLLIATGSALSCRWIPSELNVADEGSRQWEGLRTGKVVGESKQNKETDFEGCLSTSGPTKCSHAETLASSPQHKVHWKQSTAASPREPAGSHQGRKSREATKADATSVECSSFSGSDISGTACSDQRSSDRLCLQNERLPGVCKTAFASHENSEEPRRQLQRISQRHVLRRQQLGRGNKKPRSPHRPRAGLWPKGGPPSSSSLLTRLAKIGSRGHKAAHTHGVGVSTGVANVGAEPTGSFAGHTADVRRLPSARRSAEPSRRRPSHANCNTPIPQPEFAPVRSSRVFQSGALRRNNTSGFKPDAVVGRLADFETDRGTMCPSVCSDIPAAQGCLDDRTTEDRTSRKPRSPLSTETFRALLRSIDQDQIFAGSEKAWSEEFQRLPKSVQRKALAAVLNLPTKVQKYMRQRPEQDLKVWVVEVFSGSAHLSQALAKQGFWVAAWDIEYGPHCDVLRADNLSRLLQFIAHHRVVLVWLGMPCQSWSMARRWDGGPEPLRDSDLYIWGREGMSQADRNKIHSGNILLSWTFSMVNILTYWHIPWVIENPWTSRAWKTKPFLSLTQRGAILQQVDFCQYKMPWRKSTGLLSSGFPGLASCLHCCASHFGRCSATLKRHIILSGKDPNGVWWTMRAQPYPKALSDSIAVSLASSFNKG